MDFNGTLQKGFVLGKPITQENYDPSVIEALEKQGRLIKTRKRDGYKMFAAFDRKGVVRLYTDGINEIDDKLLHLKKELKKLGLKNALLVGEAVIDEDDSDDFTKVASVMKSGLEKAITAQRTYGFIRYMVFNILFLDGKPCNVPYYEILLRINVMLLTNGVAHTFPVPVLDCTLAEAQATVREKKWEGLVLYDNDFLITFRTDGKSPQRPKGCYKWKPIFEDDFIVRERVMRDGNEEVKELVLLQRDPETGKEFRCGRLGSFTREMRRTLADEAQYPIVVQAAFEDRFEKTGKIRNARFMRLRPDKKIEDCIAPRSYRESK
ncbi:MAG: dependent ligase domain [Candidatus Parcubacteria bacterium]